MLSAQLSWSSTPGAGRGCGSFRLGRRGGNMKRAMKREYDFSRGKRGPVISVPKGKTRTTIRLDDDVPDWFRQQADLAGGNYQTLINDALRRIGVAETVSLQIVKSLQATLCHLGQVTRHRRQILRQERSFQQGLQLGIVIPPQLKPFSGLLPLLAGCLSRSDSLGDVGKFAGCIAFRWHGIVEAVERCEVAKGPQFLALIQPGRLYDCGKQ